MPKASSFDRVLHTLYFSLYEYFLSKEIFPPRKVGEAFYATELLVHVIKVLLRSKETDVNQQFPFFFLLRGRKKREKYQIIKLYNEAKPDSNLNFDIIMISLKFFFRNSESFKAKDCMASNLTRGCRLCPPYTGVHTKFWKPQAYLLLQRNIQKETDKEIEKSL